MSRFVLEANVRVSALLCKDSTPRKALDQARRHGTILLSAASLSELRAVLARPRFDRYVTRGERDGFLAALAREGEIVAVAERVELPSVQGAK